MAARTPSSANPERPFYRLHASTLVLLLPIAVVLGLLTVPAMFRDDQSGVWFDHGWPWVYLGRQAASDATLDAAFSTAIATNNSISLPPSTPAAPLLNELLSEDFGRRPEWLSRWSWWSPAESCEWHPSAALADAAVAALVLGASAAVLEWRRRRHARAWQLSLAELACLTAAVAGVLGWWQANVQQTRLEKAAAQRLDATARGGLHTEHTYCGMQWLRQLLGRDIVKPFERVTAIDIGWWRLPQPPADLAVFRSLKRAVIDRVLDPQSLADWLQATQSFEEVEIGTAYLDDDALGILCRTGKVTSLSGISYYRSEITDAGISHLCDSPRLQKLDLARTRVTDAGMRALASLRQLRHLSLCETEVTDSGVAALTLLDNLEALNLGETRVTDAGLRHIALMKRLKDLDLHGTKVTSSGLAVLAALPHLESLNLQGTKIDDEAVPALKSIKGLKELKLPAGQQFRSMRQDLEAALPGVKMAF